MPGDDGAVYIFLVDLSGKGMRRTLARGPHLWCQSQTHGANDRLSQCRCEVLGKFHLNLYHCPVNERGLRASPLNSLGIERNYIPERACVTAAVWLRSGQLLIQLSGNNAVLIPELFDPGI